MPLQHTTEFAATSSEVIQSIVKDIRSSPRRLSVFEAVYSGGRKPKDAKKLANKTGLSEVAVLQLATPMAHKQFFEQVRNGGRVTFRKYDHINAVKYRILNAAKSTRHATMDSTESANGRRSPGPKHPRWQTTRSKHKPRLRFDVFVSHASQDKDFVGPLVKALEKARITVWYDKSRLKWGDDLRSSIDRGLANCRYGIVVLSKSFLSRRKWTEYELNGLFAKERAGKRVILPIWHKVTRRDLLKYSPTLADRLAKISTRDSAKEIIQSLRELLTER